MTNEKLYVYVNERIGLLLRKQCIKRLVEPSWNRLDGKGVQNDKGHLDAEANDRFFFLFFLVNHVGNG